MKNTIIQPKGAVNNLFLIVMLILASFAVSLATAPPSFASCPKGQVCDGAGNGAPAPPGGGTPNPGGGNTPGPGDGGMTGPVDPYAFSIWNPADQSGLCPTRDDGKAAYGYYTYFTIRHYNSQSKVPPEPSGWTYNGFIRAGSGGYHAWERMVMTGLGCVYPPRTRLDTVPCYISTTIVLNQTAPTSRVVGTKTRQTGYTAGSSNYDACINSSSRVSFGSGLPAYGFYEIGNNSWVQNVTVETALGVDPLLGYVPAPKIVGWAPSYNTGHRVTSTASLHCSTGFESPGVWRSDWTDAPCINISYVCPVEKVKIDVSNPGEAPIAKTITDRIQLMRDGKTRELRFGLGSVHGESITVSSYKTRFVREGTPWDDSKLYNKNLFELSTSASAKGSMLSHGSGAETAWKAGKINSAFTRGYYASEADSPTKITQQVRWTGSRLVRSGVVNNVDPVSGAVDYTATYISVPTTGLCSQTATLEYVRPIGHESGL